MPIGYLKTYTTYPDHVAENEDRHSVEYAKNNQQNKPRSAMQPLPGTVKELPPEADLNVKRKRKRKTKADILLEEQHNKDLKSRNL